MYSLKQRVLCQILLLLCGVVLLCGQASAITLSELRQIIADSRESVATAHLVYIKEINDNRPIVSDKDTLEYEYTIKKINKHRRTKVDAILDYETKSVKSLRTDLRDVDALLKENNLPPKQKMNVSRSKTSVRQGTYDMVFLDTDSGGAPDLLLLSEASMPAYYMFRKISLGVIDKKLLWEDFNPILTEIDSDGKSLLRIQLTRKEVSKLKGTIECDPLLGYRFHRIQWHSDGHLTKETIADDYRDVNGVPYPFLYIKRSFDEDGKIRVEEKYVFEDVRLGVDLSADDFKIFVPAGTVFQDVTLSMTLHNIEQDGYMGIADVLELCAKISDY